MSLTIVSLLHYTLSSSHTSYVQTLQQRISHQVEAAATLPANSPPEPGTKTLSVIVAPFHTYSSSLPHLHPPLCPYNLLAGASSEPSTWAAARFPVSMAPWMQGFMCTLVASPEGGGGGGGEGGHVHVGSRGVTCGCTT